VVAAIASLKTELPLETADDILSYKPEGIHKIAPRPVLIIGRVGLSHWV
jgi:hypothetical protein